MSTRYRRFLLIVGAIRDPRWSWHHREVFKREWGGKTLHRNACPLCGHRDHPYKLEEFIVCGGCAEILKPEELVVLFTKETAFAYRVANLNFDTGVYN